MAEKQPLPLDAATEAFNNAVARDKEAREYMEEMRQQLAASFLAHHGLKLGDDVMVKSWMPNYNSKPAPRKGRIRQVFVSHYAHVVMHVLMWTEAGKVGSREHRLNSADEWEKIAP